MTRLALLLVVLLPPVVLSATVTTKEIEEALTCQCGCGLTVHSCNHLSCPSAIPLKQEIKGLVNEDLARDEILVRFRDKYGEKILAAPTTEGFNLTAWILPFVMVGGGGLVLVLTLRRWTGRPPAAAAEEKPGESISAEDRRRLDAELRDV